MADAGRIYLKTVLTKSLQGHILQVVTHPTEPSARFQSICCFDDKLLARYHYNTERAGTRSNEVMQLGEFGIIALQGL